MPYRDWKFVKWFRTERELTMYMQHNYSKRFIFVIDKERAA